MAKRLAGAPEEAQVEALPATGELLTFRDHHYRELPAELEKMMGHVNDFEVGGPELGALEGLITELRRT